MSSKVTADISCDREIEVEKPKYLASQGLKALGIHLTHLVLGPLGFLPMKLGKNLSRNMFFRWCKVYFMYELPDWVWVVLTVLAVYYSEGIETLLNLIIGTGCVILFRTTLVSLKYGYYSKYFWEQMKNEFIDPQVASKNFLLASWVNVSKKVADKEIVLELKKLKAENMILKLRKELCPSGITTCVPVVHASKLIVSKLLKTKSKLDFWSIKAFSVLYALNPFLLEIYKSGYSFELNFIYIIYSVVSALVAFIHCDAILRFLLTGTYDFRRKKLLMDECSALITVDSVLEGVLDLEDSSTVQSWYFLRRAFLDFGRKFTLRIFLYFSLILPLCIFIILLLILQIFNVVGNDLNIYFASCFLLLLGVFIVLLKTSLEAVKVNEYFGVHKDILLQMVSLKVRQHLLNLESIQNFYSNINFLIRKLDEDEILRPEKILGITINSEFMSKLLAAGLSGLFAFFQQLLR